jgi:hypothetical protein
MKKMILAALLATLVPAAAHAATLNFPSDQPAASITIPDDWKPEETESGIQAESPDGAIYISIDVAEAASPEKVVSDAIDFLAEKGVTIDTATQKESEDQLNGMTMKNLDWSGKDADGEASIGLSFVQPTDDKLLVITYWGTKGEQEKHGEALMSIIASLKPAAQ